MWIFWKIRERLKGKVRNNVYFVIYRLENDGKMCHLPCKLVKNAQNVSKIERVDNNTLLSSGFLWQKHIFNTNNRDIARGII